MSPDNILKRREQLFANLGRYTYELEVELPKEAAILSKMPDDQKIDDRLASLARIEVMVRGWKADVLQELADLDNDALPFAKAAIEHAVALKGAT